MVWEGDAGFALVGERVVTSSFETVGEVTDLPRAQAADLTQQVLLGELSVGFVGAKEVASRPGQASDLQRPVLRRQGEQQGSADHMRAGQVEGAEHVHGCRSAEGGGGVMIADDEDDGDVGLLQTAQLQGELPLPCGVRRRRPVQVAGEQDRIDATLDGGVEDRRQTIPEVEQA